MIRVRFLSLVLALGGPMLGCKGNGESSPGAHPSPAARPDTPMRLAWEEPFPALPLEDASGAAATLPRSRTGWSVVALHPSPCISCAEMDDLYPRFEPNWTTLGLGLVVVTENGAPSDTASVPMLATSTSLFALTRTLNEPTHVLVGPDGRVRFIARREGSARERLQSLFRQFDTLKKPDAEREAIVRRVFPDAASVRLESTIATSWLGPSACALGLSPWFGSAHGANGSFLGFVFPLEKETSCTTCETLYLAVGFGRDGRLRSIEEIEPVISLGEQQETKRFFERFVGLLSPEGIERVPEGLIESPKADHVTRALLQNAFALAARAPVPESGPPR